MAVKIKAPKDFWAGVMFIGCGAFFMAWALMHYQMGTAVRMGPAYFPTVLGGLLAFLGALVLIESLAMSGPPVPKVRLSPKASTIASEGSRSSLGRSLQPPSESSGRSNMKAQRKARIS